MTERLSKEQSAKKNEQGEARAVTGGRRFIGYGGRRRPSEEEGKLEQGSGRVRVCVSSPSHLGRAKSRCQGPRPW